MLALPLPRIASDDWRAFLREAALRPESLAFSMPGVDRPLPRLCSRPRDRTQGSTRQGGVGTRGTARFRPTRDIETLLRCRADEIDEFPADDQRSFLALS